MALRRVRAVARLLHAVVHGLHGLGIVLFRFPHLGREERLARIRWWSAKMLRALGIALRVDGTPARGGSLLALNHISWLDIMVVHAVVPSGKIATVCPAESASAIAWTTRRATRLRSRSR